jgi:hypothetical protein
MQEGVGEVPAAGAGRRRALGKSNGIGKHGLHHLKQLRQLAACSTSSGGSS